MINTLLYKEKPYHLWIGTPKDNINDCLRKGQHTVQLYNAKEFFKGGIK